MLQIHNKSRTVIFFVLLIANSLLFACNEKRVEVGYEITEREKKSLKEKSLQGDITAYSKLQEYYTLNNEINEQYLLSLIVANKYNNKEAYFSLYWSLLNSEGGDFSIEELLFKLDNRTKYYCLYYLLKSYELGYYESIYHCTEIFHSEKNFPKSETYLDSIKSYK